MYVHKVNRGTPTDWFTVELYDSEGHLLAQESGEPESTSAKTLVGMFSSVAVSSEKPSYPIGNPDEDTYVLAKMTLNGVSIQRKCYFSFRDIDSYCIDSEQNVYAISETVSKNFLSSSYAEPFYDTASPPVLTTLNGETVTPSSALWHYQNRSGTDIQASHIATTEQELLYEITGTLGISFSQDPDICQVQVFNSNGTEVFQGSHTELSTLTAKVGDILSVRIHASWKAAEHETSYGNVEYRFSVKIRNQSLFSIHKDETTPGDCILLSCTNITTLSKITFTVEPPELIPTPIFHLDGTNAYALIAFPEETKAQTVRFSVSYGASKEEFTVTVTDRQPNAQHYSFPELNRSDSPALRAEAKTEWMRILQTLPSVSDTFPYFRGNFSDPTQNGYSVAYTHGSTLSFGSEPSSSVLTAIGTEFCATAASGLGVYTLHHGRVLQVGTCDLLGNYVVIDHGCGLYTWYGHLSQISVEVGEVLKQGDRIGQCGTGGLSTADGFLLLCTVYDTVMDPASILGKEIPLEPN